MFVITLIIAAAFFLESIFGFGGGMVSIPLLGLILPIQDAVTLVLFFQFGLAALSIRSLRRIDWPVLRLLAPGLLCGTELGILTLGRLPEATLRHGLGAVLLLYFLFRSFLRTQLAANTSGAVACTIGLVGGYMQAATGMGGPVFSVYLFERTRSPIEFRSTIICLFAISSLCRLLILIPTGQVSVETVTKVIWVLPVFAAAVICGNRLHGRVRPQIFSHSIDALHICCGLMLICS